MQHSRSTRWFLEHIRALHIAFAEFIKAPLANIVIVLVIGVAVTLPLCLYIALQNMQYVDTTWEITTPSISLYLKTSTEAADAQAFVKSLQVNKAIEKVTYISPEQGLQDFEKSSSFATASHLFQHNPIPPVIVVVPNQENRSPEALKALFATLKASSFVDEAQLDINWVTRLYDLVQIGEKVAQALGVLFGFLVILIVGHTLRSQLSHHMKEIQILRLIGATNAFIRRPLLYRGAIYGLLGGVIAWIILEIILGALQSPIAQLAETYRTSFTLSSLSFLRGAFLIIGVGFLGYIGAFLVAYQFLNLPEKVE